MLYTTQTSCADYNSVFLNLYDTRNWLAASLNCVREISETEKEAATDRHQSMEWLLRNTGPHVPIGNALLCFKRPNRADHFALGLCGSHLCIQIRWVCVRVPYEPSRLEHCTLGPIISLQSSAVFIQIGALTVVRPLHTGYKCG